MKLFILCTLLILYNSGVIWFLMMNEVAGGKPATHADIFLWPWMLIKNLIRGEYRE